MSFEQKILNSKNISEIFEIVKAIASKYLNVDQAGLLIGLSDLGSYGNSFIGAFYSLNANTIVINKRPLSRIKQTNPELYNPYLFHVVMHEYLHSLGMFEESQVRQLVYEISAHYFGEKHIISQIASNLEKFIPNLVYPARNYEETLPEDLSVEYMYGIDRTNTGYIM